MNYTAAAVTAALACIAAAILFIRLRRRLMRLTACGSDVSVTVIIRARGKAAALEQAVKSAAALCEGGKITIIDSGMTKDARRVAELTAERSPRITFLSGGNSGETECRESSSTSE